MRSILGKEVRKRFAEGLMRRTPRFERAETLLPFATAFSHATDARLHEYIILSMDHMYDHFDLYIAWSDDGRIPDSSGALAPPNAPKSPLVLVRELWGGRKADFWWELAPAPSLERPESFYEIVPLEQSRSKVASAVNDALRCVDEYVIPYFARVAAARGLSFPGDAT